MSQDLFAELDEILDDPYFDGENIQQMTAEQLRGFARRRVERARNEHERQQAMADNEMLLMLAYAREMGF
jgi:hypothetical protein